MWATFLIITVFLYISSSEFQQMMTTPNNSYRFKLSTPLSQGLFGIHWQAELFTSVRLKPVSLIIDQRGSAISIIFTWGQRWRCTARQRDPAGDHEHVLGPSRRTSFLMCWHRHTHFITPFAFIEILSEQNKVLKTEEKYQIKVKRARGITIP